MSISNEGDCDSNSECLGTMVCGNDNCPHERSQWLYPGTDCCHDPDKGRNNYNHSYFEWPNN